jgi:hypothetical protein
VDAPGTGAAAGLPRAVLAVRRKAIAMKIVDFSARPREAFSS